jgi:hypothetical protein
MSLDCLSRTRHLFEQVGTLDAHLYRVQSKCCAKSVSPAQVLAISLQNQGFIPAISKSLEDLLRNHRVRLHRERAEARADAPYVSG